MFALATNKTNTLVNAIFAGICIGIGCNVYLSCNNKYIGAILFTVGLIVILTFGFNLYTGKVGYLVAFGPKHINEILIILLGNIIGCILFGLIFPSEQAVILCINKLSLNFIEVLFKSIMCGILMFIAVDSYNSTNKFVLTFLCITTFILSVYEHSIADIIYFIMGKVITPKALVFILIVILGNAIGGMAIPLSKKLLIKINNTKL